MSFSFSEEELRLAVINTDRLIIAALPHDQDIDHEFSRKFDNKMKALIRRNKEKTYHPIFNKRFIAILAAIIILLASAMSVSAVREVVIDFVTDAYEQFTHIFFDKPQSSSTYEPSENEFVAYAPTFIPNGFDLIIQDFNGQAFIQYIKDDDYINYSQQGIHSVSMDINTEGIALEELQLNNLPAKYYSNKGVQNLIWYDEKYMYMVYSTLDKATVIKIAESVELYQD